MCAWPRAPPPPVWERLPRSTRWPGGWADVAPQGKDPEGCSHGPALSSLQIESHRHNPEPFIALCVLSDRNRSSAVSGAFCVVESLLAEKEVTAHTWVTLK